MLQETHEIHVLIVHEYPLMGDIICKVIEGEPDIHVDGLASSIEETKDLLTRKPIDVVLISPRLPENGSIKLTRILVRRIPAVRIIILGISESREQVLQYIEAGASGYVVRESSVDDLLNVIRAAHEGKALISPEIALVLIHRVKTLSGAYMEAGISPPDITSLTARELEVLHLMANQLSNQEIADQLFIGLGTVKNHVHNILDKLGVTNREEAANLYAYVIKTWSNSELH